MSVRWDADAYERLGDPQLRWALEVLAWRRWNGDERVLDAGCGPGRVTEEIVRRVPRGQVVAVDQDPGMLEKARIRLAGHANVEVAQGDVAHLPALGVVDVVVSTAVLHWVPDHAAAFRGFHRALRPGGELLAQFGGQGNIASLVEVARKVQGEPAFAAHFRAWQPPWHFERADVTASRLRDAGFVDVEAELQPKPTPFAGRAEFLAFCASAPLRPHLGLLDARTGASFVAAVGDAWERDARPWQLDYVRLNVRARA